METWELLEGSSNHVEGEKFPTQTVVACHEHKRSPQQKDLCEGIKTFTCRSATPTPATLQCLILAPQGFNCMSQGPSTPYIGDKLIPPLIGNPGILTMGI